MLWSVVASLVFVAALAGSSCNGLSAFVGTHQLRRSSNARFPSSRNVVDTAATANAWEDKLEQAFLPNTTQSQRQMLFRELVGEWPILRDSLASSVKNATPTLDNLRALRQQVSDVLWEEKEKSSSDGLGTFLSAFPKIATAALEQAPAIFRRLTEKGAGSIPIASILREARGAFQSAPTTRTTPTSLPFEVLESSFDWQVRKYKAYGEIRCRIPRRGLPVASAAPLDIAEGIMSSVALRRLLRYTEGENHWCPRNSPKSVKAGTSSSLTPTLPVIIHMLSPSEISIPLPEGLSPETAPLPSKAGVRLGSQEGKILAVKPFTGFITSKEVERQRSALRKLIRAQAEWEIEGDDNDANSWQVFQYHYGQPLPWLRQNEIAVQVKKKEWGNTKDVVEEPQGQDMNYEPPSDSA